MIAIVVGFFIVGCLIGLIPFVLIGIKKASGICGIFGFVVWRGC